MLNSRKFDYSRYTIYKNLAFNAHKKIVILSTG